MKKHIFIATAISTLLISACNQPGDTTSNPEKPAVSTGTPAPADTSKVMVTVNGESITQTRFEVFARSINKDLNPANITAEIQQRLLNEMINRTLLEQYALEHRLQDKPVIAASIALQRQLQLAVAAEQELVANGPAISEQEIQNRYETAKQNAHPFEYHIQHINVTSREEADAIIARLDKGEDFNKLAGELSLDASGKKGGDLGWIRKASLPEQVFTQVAALDKGSYSPEPVQTRFGWQVVKIVDIRPAVFPELAALRKQIMAALKREQLVKAVNTLKAKATIESALEKDTTTETK